MYRIEEGRWAMRKSDHTCLAAEAILLLLVLPVSGQDWPQWRGPNRDGIAHGITIPTKWPKTLREEWQVPVAESFSSSPVVVGANIYVFAREKDDEIVRCLDLTTGKEKWRSEPYAAPYRVWPGEGVWHKGPRSTPTVSGGKIYTTGVSGVLSCLDAKTGKLLWRKNAKSPPPYGGPMSPLVADGLCIVHFGCDGKEDGLTAFDAATGDVKWRLADGRRPGYGSPMLFDLAGERQVVVVSGWGLVGLSAATGRKLWDVPFRGEHPASTPILHKDLLIFSDYRDSMRAIRLEKRESGIAVKEVWKGTGLKMLESTPVLKGNLLFGTSPQQRWCFFCIDADTGKTLWEKEDKQGFGYVSIINAGGVVLFQGSNGRLVVLQAKPDAYELLADYRVSDVHVWAHPVFLGDRILIRDEKALKSFRIEPDSK
jgi:outer membrane protein assembly factor BamB